MVSNRYIYHTLKDLPDFRGCWACDQLSKINFDDDQRHQIVINTGHSSTAGQHFVYLELPRKGDPIFIDSFGMDIKNDYISSFLLEKGYTQYVFNRQQVQSFTSVYCGFFCIHATLCRAMDHSVKRILSKFDWVLLDSNDARCIKLIEESV